MLSFGIGFANRTDALSWFNVFSFQSSVSLENVSLSAGSNFSWFLCNSSNSIINCSLLCECNPLALPPRKCSFLKNHNLSWFHQLTIVMLRVPSCAWSLLCLAPVNFLCLSCSVTQFSSRNLHIMESLPSLSCCCSSALHLSVRFSLSTIVLVCFANDIFIAVRSPGSVL